jgi:hypothetical protein
MQSCALYLLILLDSGNPRAISLTTVAILGGLFCISDIHEAVYSTGQLLLCAQRSRARQGDDARRHRAYFRRRTTAVSVSGSFQRARRLYLRVNDSAG